ncbi:MAG: ribonuclease P protein component [Candidatus Liptonbacteria bacterium]|nr:ribonuclease P protein component [Candidatus Liptonbacteria bacterium]
MIAKKFRAPKELFSKRPWESALSAHFQIKAFPNDRGYNRFGVVVSLRADRRSVGRHFWKRFVLDMLSGQANFGKDFIIVAKPGLNGISKKEAEKELKEIFLKVNQQK